MLRTCCSLPHHSSLMICILFVLLHNDASIVSAKSERVAQSCTHFALLRLVEGKVQIVVNLGVLIAIFMVDGRRNNIVGHGESTNHGLQASGST